MIASPGGCGMRSCRWRAPEPYRASLHKIFGLTSSYIRMAGGSSAFTSLSATLSTRQQRPSCSRHSSRPESHPKSSCERHLGYIGFQIAETRVKGEPGGWPSACKVSSMPPKLEGSQPLTSLRVPLFLLFRSSQRQTGQPTCIHLSCHGPASFRAAT